MGTSNTRIAKVGWFKSIFHTFFTKKPDAFIDKDKLIANFALENNSTRRCGLEILRLFENAGKIKVKGNEVRK